MFENAIYRSEVVPVLTMCLYESCSYRLPNGCITCLGWVGWGWGWVGGWGGAGAFSEQEMNAICCSVCPRTRVVPYGWHRFWLMHAYLYMFRLHVWDSQKENNIPDIYNNLDKWDIYVRGSRGAYMHLQQRSPVLIIPQRMYFIGISYYISGILFYLVVAWYMHSKHVKYSFVDKK